MRQSPQGHKADAGKNRLELLPFDALDEVGQVMTLGAAKYGDRNWERGINYDRVFGALMRHAWAWFRGQDKVWKCKRCGHWWHNRWTEPVTRAEKCRDGIRRAGIQMLDKLLGVRRP